MRKWWKEAKVTAFNPPGSNYNLLPYLPPPIWTVEDFEGITWSDECSVARNPIGSQIWVFRAPQEKWPKDFIVPCARKGASLMVWGCLWAVIGVPLYRYHRIYHPSHLPADASQVSSSYPAVD